MRFLGYNIVVKKNARPLSGGVDRGYTDRGYTFNFFKSQRDNLVFSKSDILDCFKMISDRLGNAVFRAKIDFNTCNEVFKFVHDDRLQLIRRLFIDGFVIVDTEGMKFVNNTSGRVVSYGLDNTATISLHPWEVCYVSETFKATGKSDYNFLCDKIKFLDSLNSADFNLIDNYGAMGIVSPESDNSVTGAEFSNEDIKDLQDRYQKHYGIQVGKWSLMFVPRPVKYNAINLPISALQINEKRLYLIKNIYAALGIPKELSVYFENAKYSNRNEAELDFYSNTITKWANICVTLVELIYNNIKSRKEYLLANEFWFDFVGVYALTDAKQKEKETARVEFEFWQKVKQTEPQYAQTADARIKDLIENL